jgi:hypothetical protein
LEALELELVTEAMQLDTVQVVVVVVIKESTHLEARVLQALFMYYVDFKKRDN